MDRSKEQPNPNLGDLKKERANFVWERHYPEFYFHKTGKVNYAYEVSDWQIAKGYAKKSAIIAQKPDGNIESVSFEQLAELSTIMAGHLQKAGLKAGDRFGLYAPKSIKYAIVLLAAIKCGAIAVPLFEAFGSDAIVDRLTDCGAEWLYATGKLAKNLNYAGLSPLKHILTDESINTPPGVSAHLMEPYFKGEPDSQTIQFGDLETPFIIHYTSGSTAKPKGILLANRAMIGHMVTAKYVLDLHPEDLYWNTGDPGWVTGMVYNFFAPLLLGVTVHLFEGPFQPLGWINFMRDRGITVWYSTPTAFRLLRYYCVPLSEAFSVRHIVSAGEPLNPSLIDWTMEHLGVPIHDSWYMTENGHQLINNYRSMPIKKGSMGKPLPGIEAAILDEAGNILSPGKIGRLAIKAPWPGLMKTVWNNSKKFEEYFYKDWYISGDSAYEDEEGYFWFQGREDDMIKSAAERVSPFEIESVLMEHPLVAEAGVIGKPHELYGNIIKAFVLLKSNAAPDDQLKVELMKHIRSKLSVHEVPREIEFVEKLPKTRSGKIMRRVLRARETGLDSGDLSTLDVEMNPN